MFFNTSSPEGRAKSVEKFYKYRVISSTATGETQETETKALPKAYVDKPGYSSETENGGVTPYIKYNPTEEYNETKNPIGSDK